MAHDEDVSILECERMVAVSDESQRIGHFLDWLNDQGIHLAVWERKKNCDYESGPLMDGGGLKWRCEGGTVTGHPSSNKPGEVSGPCQKCDGTGLIDRVEPRLSPIGERYESLLARFYGIDLDKVEAERRAMLQALRADT